MFKSSFAVAVIATLLSAAPVVAAPVLSIANDTNGSNTPRTNDPNSAAAQTAWLATFSTLSRRTGDLSTAVLAGNAITISFGFGLKAIVTSLQTPSLNTTPTGSGQYTAPGVSGPYILAQVETLTFQFNNPLSAFGFLVTDMGDGPSTMTLKRGATIIPGGNVLPITCGTTNCIPQNSTTQNGAVSFLGVTDSTHWFDTIVFDVTNSNTDGVGISSIIVGVPEPAPIGVLGAGLLALGAMTRKSRKTVEATHDLVLA